MHTSIYTIKWCVRTSTKRIWYIYVLAYLRVYFYAMQQYAFHLLSSHLKCATVNSQKKRRATTTSTTMTTITKKKYCLCLEWCQMCISFISDNRLSFPSANIYCCPFNVVVKYNAVHHFNIRENERVNIVYVCMVHVLHMVVSRGETLRSAMCTPSGRCITTDYDSVASVEWVHTAHLEKFCPLGSLSLSLLLSSSFAILLTDCDIHI